MEEKVAAVEKKAAAKKPEWVEVECAYCKGTGGHPFGWGKCQVCGGKGTVRIKPPYYSCVYCGGGGRTGPHLRLPCQVCKGKGVIYFKGETQNCRACNGSGKDLKSPLRLPCVVCNGTGLRRA